MEILKKILLAAGNLFTLAATESDTTSGEIQHRGKPKRISDLSTINPFLKAA